MGHIMVDSNEVSAEQPVDFERPFLPNWRKSSYSGGSNNCVEAADGAPGEQVWVRDSKNPDGPVLKFTSAEWKAFVAGVRDGEFGV